MYLAFNSLTAVPSLITDAFFSPVSFPFTFFLVFLFFLEKEIVLRMQVFGRWDRGPKHPVDSAVSTLIIALPLIALTPHVKGIG